MDETDFENWQRSAFAPALRPGQVHLWRAGLGLSSAESSLAWQMLSLEEQARANRFRFALHRGRFMAAHAFLRAILSRYIQIPANQIQLAATAKGKPHLADPSSGFRFNLSHSGDLMVLALSWDIELGVDVEIHAAQIGWRDIARSYFSTGEQAALERESDEGSRLEKFYRTWTLKEAYLKARGDGLTDLLEQVEVDLGLEAVVQFLHLPGGEEEKPHWQVFSFRPASGASGALVTERQPGCEAELLQFTAETLSDCSV